MTLLAIACTHAPLTLLTFEDDSPGTCMAIVRMHWHYALWLLAPLCLWIIWREVRRSAWQTLRDRYVDGGPYVDVVYRTTAMGTSSLEDEE